MTVIERTECVEHGAARMIGGRCHASVSNYVLCLRDGVTVEYVPASQLEGAVTRFERVGKLASWIERDRREPDKVLMYAQELAQLAEGYGGAGKP